jgi:hypothetical protein
VNYLVLEFLYLTSSQKQSDSGGSRGQTDYTCWRNLNTVPRTQCSITTVGTNGLGSLQLLIAVTKIVGSSGCYSLRLVTVAITIG